MAGVFYFEPTLTANIQICTDISFLNYLIISAFLHFNEQPDNFFKILFSISGFFVRFDVRDDTYLWLYQIYEIFRGCEGKMVVVHCRRGCRWDLFGFMLIRIV